MTKNLTKQLILYLDVYCLSRPICSKSLEFYGISDLSERIAKDHKAMTMSRMFAGAMSMGSQSSSGYCPPRGLQAEATQGGIGSHCGYCGETRPDMKKCARCKSVLYCSKACQQLDWKKSHRKSCKPK